MPASPSDYVQVLMLERRDPTRNMARFYVLAVEPTLFGEGAALVREWGRLGTIGQRRLDLHQSPSAAGEALDVWLSRKLKRGYAVQPSTATRVATIRVDA